MVDIGTFRISIETGIINNAHFVNGEPIWASRQHEIVQKMSISQLLTYMGSLDSDELVTQLMGCLSPQQRIALQSIDEEADMELSSEEIAGDLMIIEDDGDEDDTEEPVISEGIAVVEEPLFEEDDTDEEDWGDVEDENEEVEVIATSDSVEQDDMGLESTVVLFDIDDEDEDDSFGEEDEDNRFSKEVELESSDDNLDEYEIDVNSMGKGADQLGAGNDWVVEDDESWEETEEAEIAGQAIYSESAVSNKVSETVSLNIVDFSEYKESEDLFEPDDEDEDDDSGDDSDVAINIFELDDEEVDDEELDDEELDDEEVDDSAVVDDITNDFIVDFDMEDDIDEDEVDIDDEEVYISPPKECDDKVQGIPETKDNALEVLLSNTDSTKYASSNIGGFESDSEPINLSKSVILHNPGRVMKKSDSVSEKSAEKLKLRGTASLNIGAAPGANKSSSKIKAKKPLLSTMDISSSEESKTICGEVWSPKMTISQYLTANKGNKEARHIDVVSKYFPMSLIRKGEDLGQFTISKNYLRK